MYFSGLNSVFQWMPLWFQKISYRDMSLSSFFSKNGSAAHRPSNMQPAALRLTAGSLVPTQSLIQRFFTWKCSRGLSWEACLLQQRLEVLTDCPEREAGTVAAACVHVSSWGRNLVCVLRSHSSAGRGGGRMPLV